MKNILVPTDFSACATYATRAAFDIAEYYGACVHLYTNVKVHRDWANWSDEEKENWGIDNLETYKKLN